MAAINVQRLQDAMHNLLNPREQGIFIESLNTYQNKRNINDFALAMRMLLDTPAKRQIAAMLRRIIPKKDVPLFDQLINGYEAYNSLPSRKMGNDLANIHRASSAMSMPARQYQTLPGRSSNASSVVRRPASQGDSAQSLHLPNWEAGVIVDIKRIKMEQPFDSSKGLGFSIRGGAEHGIGIYVSYVDVASIAERKGLVPGDQLLSINGKSMHKISHTEAAKIIKSAKHLDIEVRNVGRVPGSFETHQTYTWVDKFGRTVSPPPEVDNAGRYEHGAGRKSGLMLLKASDERKVNIQVTDGRKLGLMIRGGNDFGLGIYITGIDRGSVAENAGIRIGDQILDVNGTSFLDICHADAVKMIKGSKHMILTIKDVGKLPYARTTYDHTQWITGQRVKKESAKLKNGSSNSSSKVRSEPIFKKGAGSQLMHSSLTSTQAQRGMIEDQAKQVLNESERQTLAYYLTEYESNQITVDALVLALSELLNTEAKFSLFSQIRGIISVKDIEHFDSLIIDKEVDFLKDLSIENENGDVLPNPYSDMKRDDEETEALYKAINEIEDIYDEEQMPTTSQTKTGRFRPAKPKRKKIGPSNNEVTISNKPEMKHASTSMDSPMNGHDRVSNTSHHEGPTAENHNLVTAELHNNHINDHIYEHVKGSPSEDSGVEINGTQTNNNKLVQSIQVQRERVTLSEKEPVIINEVIEECVPDDTSLEVAFYTSQPQKDRRHHGTSPQPPPLPLPPPDQALRLQAQQKNDPYLKTRRLSNSTKYPAQNISNLMLPNTRTSEPVYKERLSPNNNHDSPVMRQKNKKSRSSRSRSRSNDRNRSRSRSRSQSTERNSFQGHVSRKTQNIPKTSSEPTEYSPERAIYHEIQDLSRQIKKENKHQQPSMMVTEPIQASDVEVMKSESSPIMIRRNKETKQRRSRMPDYKRDFIVNSDNLRPEPADYSGEEYFGGFQGRKPQGSSDDPDDPSQLQNAHFDIELREQRLREEEERKRQEEEEKKRKKRELSPRSMLKMNEKIDSKLQKWAENGDMEELQLPDGEIELVTIYKVKPTLGIAIEGGANTKQPLPRIINIQPSGSAHESGGLREGHIILEVNGHILHDLEHRECARIIAEAFRNKQTTMIEFLVLDPLDPTV